jgi:putative SOS response-associated peptidase YedK
MCGRFSLSATPQDVRALFAYEDQPNFPPRTNVAPTEPIGVVVEERGRRRFVLMRWGFVPAWCKDPATFPLLVNARGESVAEKPAFRNAVRRRRCIVPADGFYEWRREGQGRSAHKQPYLIKRRDGRPMAMAGLWETYVSPDGGEIDTALVVTTNANGLVSAIHDRMPVIIEPADFSTWLDCSEEDPGRALSLVRPAGDDLLVMEPCEPSRPKPFGPRRSPRPEPIAPPKGPETPSQGSLF